MAKQIDWAKRGKQREHPLRKRILERMLKGEISPVILSEEWKEPVGNISYHVRVLKAEGAVRLTRTAPARGSTEHFYKLTKRAICYTNGYEPGASSEAGSQA